MLDICHILLFSIIAFSMLSPNCHEKLVALVNCMASSTTRSQMAEHKLTIKQLL